MTGREKQVSYGWMRKKAGVNMCWAESEKNCLKKHFVLCKFIFFERNSKWLSSDSLTGCCLVAQIGVFTWKFARGEKVFVDNLYLFEYIAVIKRVFQLIYYYWILMHSLSSSKSWAKGEK